MYFQLKFFYLFKRCGCLRTETYFIKETDAFACNKTEYKFKIKYLHRNTQIIN